MGTVRGSQATPSPPATNHTNDERNNPVTQQRAKPSEFRYPPQLLRVSAGCSRRRRKASSQANRWLDGSQTAEGRSSPALPFRGSLISLPRPVSGPSPTTTPERTCALTATYPRTTGRQRQEKERPPAETSQDPDQNQPRPSFVSPTQSHSETQTQTNTQDPGQASAHRRPCGPFNRRPCGPFTRGPSSTIPASRRRTETMAGYRIAVRREQTLLTKLVVVEEDYAYR